MLPEPCATRWRGGSPAGARTQLADDQDKSAAQLRAEIEEVRDDLGDTAAALAAKTDVKTRARERATRTGLSILTAFRRRVTRP